MKKALLSIFAGILSIGLAGAQCTPDLALAGESFGLWPDTIAYIPACAACGDETRVVDLVTLTDTMVVAGGFTVTIFFDAFKIMQVQGMPAGITYGTDVESGATTDAPFGEWIMSGSGVDLVPTQGCVYINGSGAAWSGLIGGGPASDGIYPLDIVVDVRIESTIPADLSFLQISDGDWLSTVNVAVGGGLITISDYFLDVRASGVGIEDMDPSRLGILDNYPNPVDGVTTIEFNSPQAVKDLKFTVYSIIGNEVFSEQISTIAGVNSLDFDASELSSGVYVYSLNNGRSTVTSKMTVK